MAEALRIIPLGGLGKNMTVYEHDGDTVVVDSGLAFPRDEHLGVDLILPDFTYLRDPGRTLRAVILTHGHEDHVGALPYLLREVRVEEVWATRLTLGLVKSKLDEHGLLRASELREIDPEAGAIQLGSIRAEFVRMAHSVPDSVAVVLETQAGRVLHTGDWKLDHTPVDGLRTDVGRKVCVVGRSMRKNLNIARNLGYIDMPEDALIRPVELEEYAPGEVLILCTGSQGEPLSALVRIAYDDHPAVRVERGDTVIISARPVPGNELRVHDAINQLAKAGAEVLHQENAPVHVSGHGHAEELRTMISLVRPKAMMPVHGEFRMLAAHARLAEDGGVPPGAIVLAENGAVVELTPAGARVVDEVESGVTFVDGLGVGDVRDVALRDRRHLSEGGVLIVVATLGGSNGRVPSSPELISRGFAESDALLEEMRAEADRVLRDLITQDIVEIKLLQEHLHDGLGQLIYDRTGRRPMILPVVVEV